VGLAAEAVCAVCDAVGAGPYLIVGYSMGGRVALALAQRKPRLLEGGGGLVLVSSSPGLTSASARLSRWASDFSLAARIADLHRPMTTPLQRSPHEIMTASLQRSPHEIMTTPLQRSSNAVYTSDATAPASESSASLDSHGRASGGAVSSRARGSGGGGCCC
ncbi:unnamed protein product, partial [Laminaria digitata]